MIGGSLNFLPSLPPPPPMPLKPIMPMNPAMPQRIHVGSQVEAALRYTKPSLAIPYSHGKLGLPAPYY